MITRHQLEKSKLFNWKSGYLTNQGKEEGKLTFSIQYNAVHENSIEIELEMMGVEGDLDSFVIQENIGFREVGGGEWRYIKPDVSQEEIMTIITKTYL